MPKLGDEDEEAFVEGLIRALEKAKKDAGKKSREEEQKAASAVGAMAEEEGRQKLREREQEDGGRGCGPVVKGMVYIGQTSADRPRSPIPRPGVPGLW
ncbi:hypothetical protein ACJRO7_005073 [Eucalyptus globulus]|uniref:Uncharacterized protein n=1 Tax=Eucalyptus globulus TaxID=34317 RepID=A0ABD3J2Y1_EUCGL